MKRKLFLPIIFSLFLSFQAFGWDKINISFTQPNNTPYFIGQPEFNIDANEFTTLVLKIKAKHSGTARLFWATHFDPKMNEPKSISFSLDQSSNSKEYIFNLSRQNQYWTGFVGQLLLFPEVGTDNLKLESAQVIPGNIISDIRSGWREFFIFEAPQLRSVNFIYGPKINGVSVNLYIYYLTIILAILILIIELIKSKKIDIALRSGTKKILLVCLFFWLALDGRILLDQTRTVGVDFQTFFGKSLDAKRAETTFKEYYNFIKFVDTKLPKGSGFDILHPPNYYYLEKANYYLYPTHYDKGEQYLVIYNPDGSLNNQVAEYAKNGYKPYAKYKEGAYILKK